MPMQTTFHHLLLRQPFVLCAMILFTLSVRLDADEAWLKWLPKETIAIISLKDVPELVRDFDGSSFGRFMEDPAVKEWLAPMMKDGEAPWDVWSRENTGMKLREDFANYPGASMAAFLWAGEDSASEGVLFVAFSEIKDKRDDLIAMKKRSAEIKREDDEDLQILKTEIEGVEVSYVAWDEDEETPWEDAWAEIDGILVEGNDRETLTSVFQAIRGAAGDEGPAAPGLKRFQEIAGGATDLMIYVDMSLLLERGLEWMEMLQAGEEAGANPFNPQMIVEALGLRELRGLGVAMDLSQQEERADIVLLHDENPKGVLAKLMHGSGTDPVLPAWVPAEASSAGASRYSFLSLYDTLIGGFNQIPFLGAMMQQQMTEMENNLGIKLRDDVFATMDDEMTQITEVSKLAGEDGQVIAIKLKDAKRFAASLEVLKNTLGNGLGVFEEIDYEGYQIWRMKANQMADAPGVQATQFSYVLANSHLLVSTGAIDTLYKVLNRMKNPDGESLWDKAGVRELIAALPPQFTSVGITDGKAMVAQLVQGMSSAESALGGLGGGGFNFDEGEEEEVDEEEENTSWFDPAALPSEEVISRYFGMSASGAYSLKDGAHFRLLGQPVAK